MNLQVKDILVVYRKLLHNKLYLTSSIYSKKFNYICLILKRLGYLTNPRLRFFTVERLLQIFICWSEVVQRGSHTIFARISEQRLDFIFGTIDSIACIFCYFVPINTWDQQLPAEIPRPYLQRISHYSSLQWSRNYSGKLNSISKTVPRKHIITKMCQWQVGSIYESNYCQPLH